MLGVQGPAWCVWSVEGGRKKEGDKRREGMRRIREGGKGGRGEDGAVNMMEMANISQPHAVYTM